MKEKTSNQKNLYDKQARRRGGKREREGWHVDVSCSWPGGNSAGRCRKLWTITMACHVGSVRARNMTARREGKAVGLGSASSSRSRAAGDLLLTESFSLPPTLTLACCLHKQHQK